MDYKKLKGRIKEVFDTQNAFADAMGMSVTALNQKLNNKVDWKSNEIMKACELLQIEMAEVQFYFFYKRSTEICTKQTAAVAGG